MLKKKRKCGHKGKRKDCGHCQLVQLQSQYQWEIDNNSKRRKILKQHL